MRRSEFYGRLRKAFEERNMVEFGKLISSLVMDDCDSADENRTIKWDIKCETRDYGYDLHGFDTNSLANIYIEIKSNIRNERQTILMTVNRFRKSRTIGRDNDIYLLVTYDFSNRDLKYYDLSIMVKSSSVDIGCLITECIDSTQNSISVFLSRNKNGIGIPEIAGDANSPKERKKGKASTIFKLIMYFISLAFILTFIILDGCGVYTLSMHRLILIGMFVVVCLFFFIKELKIGDFGFTTIEAKDK